MSVKKNDSTLVVTKKVPEKKKSNNKKGEITETIHEESAKQLVITNFAAMSQVIASITETLEMLVQKNESMALHIIAMEAVLAEITTQNGLNIANVNARIRAKFQTEADISSNSNRAIDVAATIASPMASK